MVFQVPYNKSKMLFRPRNSRPDWLRAMQLSAPALSLAIAATILGTAAHTFHVYHAERSANNPWWLPLWPSHFDVTGTEVFIGTSAAMILLNAVYLIVRGGPVILPDHPRLATLAILATSVPSIVLTVSAIVFNHLLDKRLIRDGRDSIRTWTCMFKHTGTAGVVIFGGSDKIANNMFTAVCKETVFDFWAMVGILIIQTGFLASATLNWWHRDSVIDTDQKGSGSDINLY